MAVRHESLEAVRHLLRRLEDDVEFVRQAAALGLRRIGWREKMPIPSTEAPGPVREWMESLAESLEKLAGLAEGLDKGEGPRPVKE